MVKEIPLTQGKVALVDDEDYERVSQYKWHTRRIKKYWYAVNAKKINNGRSMMLHRFLLNPKPNEKIDHINGDGLDNRRCNLRIATTSQNCMNKTKQSGIYSSKYKGVYWSKCGKKWNSSIRIGGISFHLGSFINEIDAAKTYDKIAIESFGEFAKTNKDIYGDV